MSQIQAPKNWENKALKDAIGNGLFVDGDWILSENMSRDGTVRLIQLADIGIGKFLDKSAKFITEIKCNELGCTLLRPDDVLISRMADPIARACVLPDLQCKCITAVDVSIIRPEQGTILPRFLTYICNSSYFKNEADTLGRGATRKRITRRNLEKIIIPVPPIPIQKKIVQKLDYILGQLEEKQKKFVMLQNELNSKINIISNDFESHLINKIITDSKKSNWKIEKLNSICEQITDGAHHTPTYVYTGIPFLRVTDIHEDEINWDRVKKIPKSEHEELIKRCRPEFGDVLYSKNGTIGISKVIDWQEEFSIFVSLALLKPKKEIILSHYLKYFLDSDYAKKQALKRSKTATVTNLHLEEIREIEIPLPSKNEQKDIVNKIHQSLNKKNQIINDCHKLLQTKENTLMNFNKLASSILSKAFSGKLVN